MSLDEPPIIIPGEKLSDSAFHMWRCLIAVAHADGVIQDGELDYIDQVFSEALTPEQRQILSEDLVEPEDVAKLLPRVTDHADRHHLVFGAALLAKKLDTFDPKEEDVIRKLAVGEVDDAVLDRLLADVRKAFADRALQKALAEAKAAAPHGLRRVVRAVVNHICGLDRPSPPPA